MDIFTPDELNILLELEEFNNDSTDYRCCMWCEEWFHSNYDYICSAECIEMYNKDAEMNF
jgi:hypothetical protein